MIENPQKKFKINDKKCQNINLNDIEKDNEKNSFAKKHDKEECYVKSNTSEWLSSKINDICRNFKIFLKKGENGKEREQDEVKAKIEEEKEEVIQKEKSNKSKSKITTTNISKKKNKRTYTQFCTTKANKEEKKTSRPLFGYISLLKSLILIYEFYTNQERKDVEMYDLKYSQSKEKEKESEKKKKKVENLEGELRLERELKKILSEKSTPKWGDEKNILTKCVNEIFSNTVNEKAGFFFAFNTLFFVDLKKFYYYVDIINTLNFMGENKCIAKENEKDKRMLIFKHIGLYFDKLNTVVINNKKENNFSHSSTLINKKSFEIFKFHELKSNKQNDCDSEKKEMEQIKEKLLLLKKEKSDEEYLYMAMDKCNKEIYLEFLKITNLFRDICEISQNKWDEINWDNTKQINCLKNMETMGKKEKEKKEKREEKEDKEKGSIKYRIEDNIGEKEVYNKNKFCLIEHKKKISCDQIEVKEKLKETYNYDDGKEQKREKKIGLMLKEKKESIMKIFNDLLSKIPQLNTKCDKWRDDEKKLKLNEENNEKTDNELLNIDEINTNKSDNDIEKDESDNEKEIEKKSDKNSNESINIKSNNDSSKSSSSDSNEEKSQKSEETIQTSEAIDKSSENSVETVSVNNKSEQSEIEDIENTDESGLTEKEEMKNGIFQDGDKEIENEKTEKEELENSEDEKKKETENEDQEIKTVEDLILTGAKHQKEIEEEKEKKRKKSKREESDERESNETDTQSSKEYQSHNSESEHNELSNIEHEKEFKNKKSENIRNDNNEDGTENTEGTNRTDKSSGYLSEDNKNVLSDEEESEETEIEENKEEETEKSTENVTEETFEKATEKEIEEETEEAIEEKIRNFLRKGENNIYNRKYVNYMKKTIVCDGLCCVENHESENKLFVKEVKRLHGLIKNKKFNEHYINEIKEPENLNCWKLRKAYKILLLLIHSIIKQTERLRHHLRDSNNYIFINSGIENYLNEQNISLIEKEIQQNDLFDGYFHENIINDFFFSNRFKTRKKKYIYYESFEQYKILLICLKDIFNDPLMKEQLNKIAYYIELGDINENYSKEDANCEINKGEHIKENNVGWLIPSYIKDFYKNFQIKEEYLKHIQSLYHNSIPTVECFNMFINCLNKNYSKIHENKLFFKYELNNTYLSLLPYVYCCNIQLIKHSEFLNLKESCQNIIKNKKIYDDFINHLSSFIFEKYYFLLPFYTPYGKFLIVIKTDKSENSCSCSCSSYDIIINSFIFPNESSFHAIIHFSHYFIKSLNSFLSNFDFYSNTPLIIFSELSDVDKQQILFPEIESQKNKNEIIVNFMFLIDSFFNNVQKIRVPREFNQGLRFLYITRLLEFYYERCK